MEALVSDESGVDDGATPLASWPAVASIATGAFALITSEFLPVALLPQIASDLGVTEGHAGLMVTMPGFIAAVAAPATIGLAGRLNRRHVLVSLLALLVVSNLIVATATSFYALMLGRLLLGTAVGGFWTIGGSLGPRLRPGAEGARATSLIFSGVSIGTVAGVPTGALIGNLLGWRVAFGITAAIALLVVFTLMVLLPSIKPQVHSGLGQVPAVLRNRMSQIGLVLVTLVFIGQFGSYTYITPFFTQITHLDPASISILLLGYGLTGFFGNLFAGWMGGKNDIAAVAGTSLLISASALGLATTGGWFPAAAFWILVWGFGFGMLPLGLQAYLFRSAPDKLETVQALFVSIAQIAIGAGALIGGVFVDNWGVVSALAFGAVAAIMNAVLVISARSVR